MSNIKKTTIVIGAGASADFCTKGGSDILAEIVPTPYELGKLVKKPNSNNKNNIAMPVGEKLVEQMMNFKDEIPKLFLYQYLKNEF